MKTKLKIVLASMACGLALQVGATTIDMGHYGVGYITPTVIPPSGLDVTYLANMISTYNGGSTATIGGYTYTISQGTLTPNPNLPSAPAALYDTGVSGSPVSYNIDLGAGGAGDYLVAQWDGPNGADAIYYISGLTGIVTLQNTVDVVNATGGAYGLSGYWLARSTSVPDGGTTALMLGAALSVLCLVRRKFRTV